MSPTAQVDVVVLQHLLNFWHSQGIDINPIWKVLGIDVTQPLPRWIAASSLSDVHRYLDEQHDAAALAVQAGRYLAQQELPLSRLLTNGESLQHCLPTCFRFSYLTVGSVSFQLDRHEDALRIQINATAQACEVQQLVALSGLFTAISSILAGSINDQDLTVYLPESFAVDTAVQRLFAYPLNSAPEFVLEISMSAWMRNNPHQNSVEYRQALREFEREDNKFREYVALHDELKEILQQCLLERNVSQEDAAARLDISVRNLQRRLKALGTTYQNLLDEARRALAMKLIVDESTPLYEISFMVGYNEPSAFYKAFKRWTGITPGEYRLTSQPKGIKPEVVSEA